MSAPVITALEPITEDATWTTTPYKLEVKGETERRVSITKTMDPETGAKTVRIVALAAAGVPVQPVGLLDYVARRILPNAKVQAYDKSADTRIVRQYALA
jgi:hypothetical protein